MKKAKGIQLFQSIFYLFPFESFSDNEMTANNPMVAKYQEELDPEDQVSIGSLNEFNTTAKQTVNDIIVVVNDRNNETENELEKTLTDEPKRPIFSLNTLSKDDSDMREVFLASTATPTDTSEMGSESGSVSTGSRGHKSKVKTRKTSKKIKKKSNRSGDEEQRRLEEFLGPDISHDTLTYEAL